MPSASTGMGMISRPAWRAVMSGVAETGILDRKAPLAVRDERGADDVQTLREALDDDEAPRVRHDSADPANRSASTERSAMLP